MASLVGIALEGDGVTEGGTLEGDAFLRRARWVAGRIGRSGALTQGALDVVLDGDGLVDL